MRIYRGGRAERVGERTVYFEKYKEISRCQNESEYWESKFLPVKKMLVQAEAFDAMEL